MPGKDAWRLALADAAGTAVGATGRALPALLGVGLLSFGAWLAWPPAGFMTAGVLVLADLVADRTASRGRPQ
jgi:hypothetical protein